MKLIEDLKMVYIKAFSQTQNRIKKNPIILLLPLAYSFLMLGANLLLSIIMGGMRSTFAAGFIAPIVSALILSSYFEMLSDLNAYNRIGLRGFKNSFTRNFASIYSVYFIMYIINILVFNLEFTLSSILMIVIFFIFNPISESIYIKDKSYMEAYTYSLKFMRENYIHWLIPLLIYAAIRYLVGFSLLEFLYTDIVEINIGVKASLSSTSIYYMRFVIVQLITAYYVVFRGALFQILSTSTMRKRAYMGDF